MPTLRLIALSLVVSVSAAAQHIPAALTTDPPPDKANPAAMQSFQIPSHGAALNAIAYLAPGPGPHPVVIVLHGFPGNEKNLDLAQSIRRAGWNAVFFDYRGSWGSPGSFSFGNSLEDTAAAIAYLRNPANAARLRADPKKIALVGHSMGGFMAAYVGSHDPGILAIGMISAANMAAMATAAATAKDPTPEKAKLAAQLVAEDILPLAGCTGESLAQDLIDHNQQWDFQSYAALYGNRPLLLVTSDDGLAPAAAAFGKVVRDHGNKQVTEVHYATDHSYSDDRIALQISVLRWLATLQ